MIENNDEKGRQVIIMIFIMMSMKIILKILKVVTVLQECPVTTKEATTIMKIKKRLQLEILSPFSKNNFKNSVLVTL